MPFDAFDDRHQRHGLAMLEAYRRASLNQRGPGDDFDAAVCSLLKAFEFEVPKPSKLRAILDNGFEWFLEERRATLRAYRRLDARSKSAAGTRRRRSRRGG